MSSSPPTPSAPLSPTPEARRLIERFSARFDELRAILHTTPPDALALRCGAHFEPTGAQTGLLRLALWERPYTISFPAFEVFTGAASAPAPVLDQAFILYYLATADGAPRQQRWIAFSDLPDGRFYNQAFQGYTGGALARRFGEDHAAFEQAALTLGGERVAHADAAFTFQALPQVPIMAAGWWGDEDFLSSYQILFDASVPHYLPTDACAVLGSFLTGRLSKAPRPQTST